MNWKFDPLCLPDTNSSALSTAGCLEEAVGMGLSKRKWLINQEGRKTRGKIWRGIKHKSNSVLSPFLRVTDLPFGSLNVSKGGWPCPSVALPGPSDEALDSRGRARRAVYIPSSALVVHRYPPRINPTLNENWAIRDLHFDSFPLPKTSLQYVKKTFSWLFFSGSRGISPPRQIQTVSGSEWTREAWWATPCAASASLSTPLPHAVLLLY